MRQKPEGFTKKLSVAGDMPPITVWASVILPYTKKYFNAFNQPVHGGGETVKFQQMGVKAQYI